MYPTHAVAVRSISPPQAPEASACPLPGVLHYGAEPRQQVRLWPLRGARPWLLVVPGGGWAHGDPEGAFARAAVAWAHRRGFHAAVLSHRLLPQAGPLQQAEDVALAMSASAQAFAEAGVGVQGCLLLAHSAGAHLAALVHAGPLRERAVPVRWLGSMLVDTAALDVPQLMAWPHAPLHDRAFGTDPEVWRACSPRHQLLQPGAPMLLVVAQGRPGVLHQARAFAGAMRDAGGRAELRTLPLAHDGMAAGLTEGGALAAALEDFVATLDPWMPDAAAAPCGSVGGTVSDTTR